MLYPYRPSAVKNRQRWNFGVVYPRAYSLAQRGAAAATDAWQLQTECLAQGDAQTQLDVRVRFLHLSARSVGELAPTSLDTPFGDLHFRIVDAIDVCGRRLHTWQEVVEREVEALALPLQALTAQPARLDFQFPASQERKILRDEGGRVVGIVAHEQEGVEGTIELSAAVVDTGVYKLTVRVVNLTPFASEGEASHDEALLRALVSTHAVLHARGGAFVSAVEPPEALSEAVAACQNIGSWPVLVGEAGARDAVLASPIILYDYPQVAPETSGDLFDATEIDELLTLRIMTLTEDEKREMREVDERARQILDRTEMFPAEHLMKLHGAVRGLRRLRQEQI